jgi:hypothetical protein
VKGHKVIAHRKVANISGHRTRIVLRADHRLARGGYTVRVRQRGDTVAHHAARVR